MRRARIQMKPNLAKSARLQPVVKENVEEPPVSEVPILKSEPEQQVEEFVFSSRRSNKKCNSKLYSLQKCYGN